MTAAIDVLMREHRQIERVLAALEGCVRLIDRGGDVDRAAVRDFGDFFANFADRCHHAKEEDRLFASMVAHGFSREAGPVGVMLFEHTEGRGHVASLRAIGGGEGPLSPEERREVAANGLAYVALLRQHILKEDRVLYPMAEQALPAAEFDRMLADFGRFEAEQTGSGEHQRLEAVAAALAAAFPS